MLETDEERGMVLLIETLLAFRALVSLAAVKLQLDSGGDLGAILAFPHIRRYPIALRWTPVVVACCVCRTSENF